MKDSMMISNIEQEDSNQVVFQRTLTTKTVQSLGNNNESIIANLSTLQNDVKKEITKNNDQFFSNISKHILDKNTDLEQLKAKFHEGLDKLKKINIAIKQNQEKKIADEADIKDKLVKIKSGKLKL